MYLWAMESSFPASILTTDDLRRYPLWRGDMFTSVMFFCHNSRKPFMHHFVADIFGNTCTKRQYPKTSLNVDKSDNLSSVQILIFSHSRQGVPNSGVNLPQLKMRRCFSKKGCYSKQ